MNKIKTVFLLLSIFTLVSCSSKLPFTPKEPLTNAALVYIYIPNTITEEDIPDSIEKYKIKVDNEKIKNYISDGEYIALDIKPGSSTIQVTKDTIFQHQIKLNLHAKQQYFLKIYKKVNNDDFIFTQVDAKDALKEIKNTVLVDSVYIDKKYVNDKLIKNRLDTENSLNNNEIDAIEKAYKLKEKNIITEEEFIKLKQKILK